MSARVLVIQHDFYDLVMFEDVGISIAIDGSIVGEFTGREGSVERWDGGGDIGYLVKEGATIARQWCIWLRDQKAY